MTKPRTQAPKHGHEELAQSQAIEAAVAHEALALGPAAEANAMPQAIHCFLQAPEGAALSVPVPLDAFCVACAALIAPSGRVDRHYVTGLRLTAPLDGQAHAASVALNLPGEGGERLLVLHFPAQIDLKKDEG